MFCFFIELNRQIACIMAFGYCCAMISLAVVNVVPVAIRSSTSNILIFSVLDDACVFKTNGGNIFLNSVGILFSENPPLSPTSR